MNAFVLDCSVAMSWCFQNEEAPYALNVLEIVADSQIYVPQIWYYEVGNTLWVGEKRGKLSSANSIHFLDLLDQLPITIDDQPFVQRIEAVLELSRKLDLSIYDASYLELSRRQNILLASIS